MRGVGAVFAPMIQVICLAELAALALDDGDPVTAEILASQARAQVERSRLVNYPARRASDRRVGLCDD